MCNGNLPPLFFHSFERFDSWVRSPAPTHRASTPTETLCLRRGAESSYVIPGSGRWRITFITLGDWRQQRWPLHTQSAGCLPHNTASCAQASKERSVHDWKGLRQSSISPLEADWLMVDWRTGRGKVCSIWLHEGYNNRTPWQIMWRCKGRHHRQWIQERGLQWFIHQENKGSLSSVTGKNKRK